jgi:hypothetical protein
MRLAWLVIAVFAARWLVMAIAYPQTDGDLAWQRWLGAEILRRGAIPNALGAETFSAPGAPWVAHEWLFSIGAALGKSGFAWDVFAGFSAFCAIAALALAAYRAQRFGASPAAVAVGTAAAGIALFDSFGVRVQVIAWPLVMLFLLLLESEGPVAWLALAVAAAWSNVHASAALAPVIAALATGGALLDARAVTPRVVRLGVITAGSLGAICLNPLGWHLPAYALMLVGSPITHFIVEWKATGLDDPAFTYGALPLLALLIVVGAGVARGGTRPRWEEVLIVAAFFWLMIGAARNIAIFSLVALAPVARGLTQSFTVFAPDPPGARPQPRERFAQAALPAFAGALAIAVAVMLLRAQDRTQVGLAAPALAALERVPGTQRVLCADFAWCGLLVGNPHARVFLDGRADPYPVKVWDDFIEIAKVGPKWRGELDAYRVDAVVAGRNGPLDQALQTDRGWKQAFADERYRLWLRAPARVSRATRPIRALGAPHPG